MTFDKWLEEETKKRNVGNLHKEEEDALRLGWECCLMANKEPVAKSPACNDGLGALQKLADMWRHEATVALTPQDEEEDKRNPDIEETLLQCADELDQHIKEMST